MARTRGRTIDSLGYFALSSVLIRVDNSVCTLLVVVELHSTLATLVLVLALCTATTTQPLSSITVVGISVVVLEQEATRLQPQRLSQQEVYPYKPSDTRLPQHSTAQRPTFFQTELLPPPVLVHPLKQLARHTQRQGK